jgi:hypothetical protein
MGTLAGRAEAPERGQFSLRLSQHGDWSSPDIRGTWERLIATSDGAGIVEKSPEFLDYLLSTHDPSRFHLATVRDGAGSLVGVVPLRVTGTGLRVAASGHVLWESRARAVTVLGGEPLLPADPAPHDLLFAAIEGELPDYPAIALPAVPVDGFLWDYLKTSTFIKDKFVFYSTDGVRRCHTIPLAALFQVRPISRGFSRQPPTVALSVAPIACPIRETIPQHNRPSTSPLITGLLSDRPCRRDLRTCSGPAGDRAGASALSSKNRPICPGEGTCPAGPRYSPSRGRSGGIGLPPELAEGRDPRGVDAPRALDRDPVAEGRLERPGRRPAAPLPVASSGGGTRRSSRRPTGRRAPTRGRPGRNGAALQRVGRSMQLPRRFTRSTPASQLARPPALAVCEPPRNLRRTRTEVHLGRRGSPRRPG